MYFLLQPLTYLFFKFKGMNPSILICAVFAIASLQFTEAFFGADIVTGSGALFTGGGGPHLLLASGTAGTVVPVAAVIGGAILLKSLALLAVSPSGQRFLRGKRSVNAEDNDILFSTIAASEPSSCVRQLICDLATGEHETDYDVILSLFSTDTPATSPKYDFAVAAALGKELKSLEACELRYTCPISSSEIMNALN